MKASLIRILKVAQVVVVLWVFYAVVTIVLNGDKSMTAALPAIRVAVIGGLVNLVMQLAMRALDRSQPNR